MLKWARLNGCPWDERTCAGVVKLGNLDVKWVLENGRPWDGQVLSFAAHEGHPEVSEWARQNLIRAPR